MLILPVCVQLIYLYPTYVCLIRNVYGKVVKRVNKTGSKRFGHAFLTLSSEAIVSYKVDNYYSKDHDSGVRYNDKSINISWMLEDSDIIISSKDKLLPYL